MKNLYAIGWTALLLSQSLPAAALCTLLCSCSASTTAVIFGIYNPLSSSPHDNNNGKVTVTCGGVAGLTIPYQIALGTGANSATYSPRKMASGANRLDYDLYTDTAHNTVWQNVSPNWVTGSIILVLLGNVSQDNTIYGRIPASQTTVLPGSYSDTVVVTVTYQ